MGRHWLAGFGILFAGFAAGIAAGYFFWSDQVRTITVEAQTETPDVREASPRAIESLPGPFEQLESEIIDLTASQSYEEAIGLLLELELLASTDTELRQVNILIEETIRLRVQQLEARRQVAEIDALYEFLTLSMPERAEYFLLLAEHRIRLKQPGRALPVLAQIENHGQLGGRARELIAELTEGGDVTPLASITLEQRGDQYLLPVYIDGRREARLILDTGASTTILSPDFVQRLGYRIGARSAQFNTANGSVTAPLVTIETISIQQAEISDLTVGVLDISTGIDGLLGMDFLSRYDFVLARDNSQLVLKPSRRE